MAFNTNDDSGGGGDWFDQNTPTTSAPGPSSPDADQSGLWQNLYNFAPSALPTANDVQKAFQQFLGHSATDVKPFANDPNYAQHIYDSPEAQAYRKTHAPGGATAPTAPSSTTTPSGPNAWIDKALGCPKHRRSELLVWSHRERPEGGGG